MSKNVNRELWMRESTEFTLSNGETISGYRVVFVRFLKDNEDILDLNDNEEYEEVIGGSVVPNLVDENYNDLESSDEFEIEDEDVVGDPEFYIGNSDGHPIEG